MKYEAIITFLEIPLVKKMSYHNDSISYTVSCSVPCQGNGMYAHGRCVCFSGWKGIDCGTPSDKCLDQTCSGNGVCNSNGECECQKGFKGEACEEGLIFCHCQ